MHKTDTLLCLPSDSGTLNVQMSRATTRLVVMLTASVKADAA